ncbi:MAG: Fe-S cluster assembly protein SufD [Pseudomonadota bacterium]|nr:Fe-S cluster assembly protein SufD [Pseudomonadota bacterium]
MSAVMPMENHYADSFASIRGNLPGAGLPWLDDLRAAAMDRYATIGLPTTRQEEWKYTNVRAIAKHAFQPSPVSCTGLMEDDLGDALMEDLQAHRFTFLNGRYSPQLSRPGKLPKGAGVYSMSAALAEMPEALESLLARQADYRANGFASLNLAFFTDGAFIRLDEGVRLERPIQLVFLTTAHGETLSHNLRNLVAAGIGSRATIIEHYLSIGDPVYLNNAVTEAVLSANAGIEHYKLQQESTKGFHVATLQAHQERDSELTSHSVSLGANLARHDINSVLDAEGAECSLNGLYITGGRQHVDYHTRVDHKKPEGVSKEYYKGVLSGKSRAVFNGKVHVHQDAQKTDAEQSNRNLLLSRDAEVDTKPELEIYADDVKCSHGATIGQLDENSVFYLRSRGIPQHIARGMLTYGFAHDVVERMGLEPVRRLIEGILVSKLPHVEASGIE